MSNERTCVTVTRLSVTPVKGTQLEDRAFIDLLDNGVVENRRFYIIDERGLMFNGKKEGRLVNVSAAYDARTERLALCFPNGDEVAGVWSVDEAVTTSFYGRPVSGHIVAGPWAAALSEFTGQAVRLVAVDRLGDAVDVHPVTIVSHASIELLRKSAPDAERLDYRRFRMLVELDGIAANEEDSWAGRQVQIGSATVQVVGPVPRCVVTSQDPDTGKVDFNTLKAIASYRGLRGSELITPTAHLEDGGKILFGIYGQVITAGRVAVGDDVHLG